MFQKTNQATKILHNMDLQHKLAHQMQKVHILSMQKKQIEMNLISLPGRCNKHKIHQEQNISKIQELQLAMKTYHSPTG